MKGIFNLFGSAPEVFLTINPSRGYYSKPNSDCGLASGQPHAPHSDVSLNNPYESYPMFMDHDGVTGEVSIRNRNAGSPLEHQGIYIEFTGKMMKAEQGETTACEFVQSKLQLVAPGEPPLIGEALIKAFDFGPLRFPCPSYEGQMFSIRYSLRVFFGRRPHETIERAFLWCPAAPDPKSSVLKDNHSLGQQPEESSKSVDVGLDGFLHLKVHLENTLYKSLVYPKIYRCSSVYAIVDMKIAKLLWGMLNLFNWEYA